MTSAATNAATVSKSRSTGSRTGDVSRPATTGALRPPSLLSLSRRSECIGHEIGAQVSGEKGAGPQPKIATTPCHRNQNSAQFPRWRRQGPLNSHRGLDRFIKQPQNAGDGILPGEYQLDSKIRGKKDSERMPISFKSERASILVHVGYPKCASTSLQRHIFNNRSAGFVAPLGDQTIHLVDHCRAIDTFEFDRNILTIRATYEQSLREDGGLINVFSHENTFLNPYSGDSTIREGIRRLRKIFPRAKFLLVIREQRSIILSSYGEFLRRGKNDSFENFIGTKKKKLGFYGSVCRIYDFRYDNVISFMYQELGKENVIVLPFEDILSEDFLIKILQYFPGIRGNTEQTKASIPAERRKRKGDLILLPFINKIRKPFNKSGTVDRGIYGINVLLSPLVPAKLVRRREKQLRRMYNHHLGGFFTASNAETSNLIGRNLFELGYQ